MMFEQDCKTMLSRTCTLLVPKNGKRRGQTTLGCSRTQVKSRSNVATFRSAVCCLTQPKNLQYKYQIILSPDLPSLETWWEVLGKFLTHIFSQGTKSDMS